MRWLALGLVAGLVASCASVRIPTAPVHIKDADSLSLSLAGVVGCDGEAHVSLDPARPVAILVHGMHGSGRGLATLADAFRADGQQAVCFRYDPRASLLRSARQLRVATAALATVLRRADVLLFGHSQGGLVARAALARSERPLPTGRYRLVTVSSPFAGIRAARSCGSIPYHLVSFGVSYTVCRAISGDSWNQIHPGAAMVRAPAELDAAVSEHLLVVTDERDTCRRYSADGLRCLQDDYVFSMREQHNARIERDRRVVSAPLAAGHVEVLGAQGAPRKLIEALQQHGVLHPGRGVHATLFDEQSAKSGW
jgi:pimeloyl-ACP methyl ester carboxylesterase